MLNSISSILSYFIALILLISAVEKGKGFKKFVHKIDDYKIVNKKLSFGIALISLLFEGYLGIKFLILNVSTIDVLLYVLMMATYTFAIAKNIYKGNVRISCGCGGVMESSRLTNLHVYRNTFLVLISIFILKSQVNSSDFSIHLSNLMWFVSALNMILIYGVIAEFNGQIKKMKRIHEIIAT